MNIITRPGLILWQYGSISNQFTEKKNRSSLTLNHHTKLQQMTFWEKKSLIFHVNHLLSRQFTRNIKPYFLWRMKIYSRISSTATVMDTLKVKVIISWKGGNQFPISCCNTMRPGMIKDLIGRRLKNAKSNIILAFFSAWIFQDIHSKSNLCLTA